MTFDLYLNIHKAIRAELFGVTLAAGATDPGAAADRAVLADRVGRLVALLVSHAEHEDTYMQDLVVRHVPALAHRIEEEHVALDARMLTLGSLADAAASDDCEARARLHDLYLELGSFGSAYLAHIDVEERQVMPALSAAVPVAELIAVHERILASIPPPEMAASLAIMLPALNVDDRVELLGGMREGAPAEVFAGVVGLAGSVLEAEDFSVLTDRLGLVVS